MDNHLIAWKHHHLTDRPGHYTTLPLNLSMVLKSTNDSALVLRESFIEFAGCRFVMNFELLSWLCDRPEQMNMAQLPACIVRRHPALFKGERQQCLFSSIHVVRDEYEIPRNISLERSNARRWSVRCVQFGPLPEVS